MALKRQPCLKGNTFEENLLEEMFPRNQDVHPLDQEDQLKLAQSMHQVLRRFPLRTRCILELRYRNGMNCTQIAHEISRTLSRVTQIINRALRKLRDDRYVVRLAEDFDFLIPMIGQPNRRRHWNYALEYPRWRVKDILRSLMVR